MYCKPRALPRPYFQPCTHQPKYCFYGNNGTWFGDVLRGPGGDPGAVVEVGASGEFANIGDKDSGFWSANLSPFLTRLARIDRAQCPLSIGAILIKNGDV